jgi:hypothetical protein
VEGGRETTGEGEGITQIPNRRRKISDMTAKEKAVGRRTRASVKADVVVPKEKSGGDTVYIYIEDGLRHVFTSSVRRGGLFIRSRSTSVVRGRRHT